MKKIALVLTLLLTLLVSSMEDTTFVNLCRANPSPTPAIYIIITIENPLNATYNTNTVTINFTDKSNLGFFCYYSLDGGDIQQIDNMTAVSKELGNDGESLMVDVPIMKGSFVLSNLMDGWHKVTIYQTDGPLIEKYLSLIGAAKCVDTTFKVDTSIASSPESFPTTLAVGSIALVIVICAGLLVYFKKHKHQE
jgi:hypothetical protein